MEKVCITTFKIQSRSLFNVLTIAEGPKVEPYGFNLVPDNETRTDADLGVLGGPRKATAEFKGNSLITYLHKLEDDVVDVIAIRTIDPTNPDVMIYTLKDVESGSDLVQTMKRQ